MKPTRGVFAQSNQRRRQNGQRALLRHLAAIGGTLFGTIPDNVRREFFCLDEKTWVWHEEWVDESGRHHAVTTRYDIRPDGILKSQGSNSYQRLSPEEEKNFRTAAAMYINKARNEIQQLTAQVA